MSSPASRRQLPRIRLALIGLALVLILTGCSASIKAVERQATGDPVATSSRTPTGEVQSQAGPSRTPSIAAPTPTSPVPTPTPASAPPIPTPTVAPAMTPVPVNPSGQSTHPPATAAPTPIQHLPTPAPTPSPTPIAPPSCSNVPVRGFGLLWSSQPSVAQQVGCPRAAEIGLAARVQPYQHGFMLWLDTQVAGVDQAPWVVIFTEADATRFRVPVDGPAWEDGATEPSGSFRWVWENVYSAQQQLGSPLATWLSTDAALQRFDTGTMIWLKSPPGGGTPMIYVIQNDLVDASAGAYQQYLDQSTP